MILMDCHAKDIVIVELPCVVNGSGLVPWRVQLAMDPVYPGVSCFIGQKADSQELNMVTCFSTLLKVLFIEHISLLEGDPAPPGRKLILGGGVDA
jgi:hypothetical protein